MCRQYFNIHVILESIRIFLNLIVRVYESFRNAHCYYVVHFTPFADFEYDYSVTEVVLNREIQIIDELFPGLHTKFYKGEKTQTQMYVWH